MVDLGKKFRGLGIQLEGVFTSAFLRALQSARHFQEGYEGVPVKLMVKLHEQGGCHVKEAISPGLARAEVEALVPGIEIGE